MYRKKVSKTNSYLYWKGELYITTAFSDGKVVYLRPVKQPACGTCGHDGEIAVVENSPLFQESAESVNTIEED